MMSPVSTSEWILMAGPAKTQGDMLNLGIRRINGLRNPLPGEAPPSAEFARFVELYEELRRADVLDVVQASGSEKDGNYFWGLHDYQDTLSDSVREFLDLLGLKVKPDKSMIILPLREQAVGRSDSAVHVQTRSAYEVLLGFEAGIDVPANHLEAGIVEPLASGVPGRRRFVTINSAEKPSDNATVQIRFRDHWFYIDVTDTRSKRSFAVLRIFIGMRLADSSAGRQPPVLTIPVN
jgi:hypothetical protein